ncbi:hypothetical protein [Nocardia fluminea]|uniref:hypothetical protein n=1 Tax=Nocardia fluminea TaxID=134984 RepID=UPI003D1415D2
MVGIEHNSIEDGAGSAPLGAIVAGRLLLRGATDANDQEIVAEFRGYRGITGTS